MAAKRTRLRYRAKGRLSRLEQECEILWATCIKLRYGNKSLLSGVGGSLDSAHCFPRTRLTTKFDLRNGVPLTRTEASYFTDNPSKFYEWLRKIWPHKDISLDDLERLSNTYTHPNEEWFLTERDKLRSFLAQHGNQHSGR